MNSRKLLFVLVAVFGLLGVCLGAFGAHSLKPYLSEYQKEIYNKAVLYHFVHTLAAYVALISGSLFSKQSFQNAAILFLLGIVGFSGSLYLLSVNQLVGIPAIILGPITPIGGVFFIAGWVLLAYSFLKMDAKHYS